MSCIFDGHTDTNQQFYIEGTPIPTVEHFKYLGSIISSDGKIEKDVTRRTIRGWMKWKQLTGVMCDKRMPIQLKGKLHKTAIRPAILYGTECWASTQQHLSKLHATEMRMLRWSAGVTLLDKVRNIHIRGSCKVAPIIDKVKERRLRWYGHILCRPTDHMVNVALSLPTTTRRHGRPPATWLTTAQRDRTQQQRRIEKYGKD
ncbi:uncharacterized protein LOC133518879 [Cydia pomonella]|uniref:uncharacterized protein LOC133518879 n=1 Tax=Cydia pomonella TaxID=82600 RepID=UPI002ADDB298|nr:uncharacterized protein LOC133518879 [Cydia pomonella]